MNIGILGLGSMGQMLVKGFLKSKAVSPSQIFVYNRTRSKSDELQKEFSFVICDSLQEVGEKADTLFLCTKPFDLYPVLHDLKIAPTKHLVSVAAGVSLADLGSVYPGAVTKVIPTVTSQELHGISLFVCNPLVTPEQRHELLTLLTAIGKAEEVTESTIETATILTSSAPGLIAGILEQFARAGTRKAPELSLDTTRRLLVETLLGTALLLDAEDMQFDQLIERVATKGGITEEGLTVLGKVLPQGFDELFTLTEAKHTLLRAKVKEQFDNERGK